MSLPIRSSDDARRNVEQSQSRIASSNNKDEALENAVKAAEAAMNALKLAKDPAEKERYSATVARLLKDAEDIKEGKNWGEQSEPNRSSHGPVRELREQSSTRPLPKSEQILLLKASYLNGFKFPPWTSSPHLNEFELGADNTLFTDEADLPLSDFQEEVFDDWKRPSEALPPPAWVNGDSSRSGPIMDVAGSVDLVQDAATDCSVVASLCAGRARVERGHARISRAIIYPHDEKTGRPLMSKNGKYILRLNFNGCMRRVIIDDRLPVSSTSRVIHVIDRRNPGLLWPALLEKAYLKVRGGYDFPGSNSGTDLWILTGWIPEQVFLQSDELDPHQLWRRISNAFNYGDVMITMGTGKMTAKTEKELGLAGEHDYAVLELREVNNQRLVLVKNPWCEGTSWRGKFKAKNETGNSIEGRNEASVAFDEGLVHSSRDLLNADEQLSPGTFWMDLDNVIQHFESIYLNWNPGLFSHRQDLHFGWDLSSPEIGQSKLRGRFASLKDHPQYAVTARAGGVVWILLWRHFRNAISSAATAEEIESGKYDIDLTGHINLAAFASGGRRVFSPEKHLSMGWYVDSPQTLLRLDDCEPGKSYTIVPLEQDLIAASHNFTLTAFSNSALELIEAAPKHPFSYTLISAWTKDTAGGNAHSKKYSVNPQFSLTIQRKTRMTLLLESNDDALNVHVKLVHGHGKRIHTIRSKDIIVDSKDYRRRCCITELSELQAGQYTIITSTFEPQQLGDFSLTVGSAEPVQIKQLPKQDAGRLTIPLDKIVFIGERRIAAIKINPLRLINLCAVVRRISGDVNRSLARASIEIGFGSERRILTASADREYTDSAEDIRVPELDLTPAMKRYGDIWLVIERMYATTEGHDERFSIELLVDQPDSVEFGTWNFWDD
ncbi:Hypothetical protein R9X50_00725200 [Acrodontium crateriforme]|uniref:Calpain catalytic domain-containing protein n=1 Tax=Acrodontium crateriforme TaxID=150365 RepID=A0AAQ3M9F3_9PEZI|nr:Hypothetical protein R9X50_00725200 [Acrodontium crateriforme]